MHLQWDRWTVDWLNPLNDNATDSDIDEWKEIVRCDWYIPEILVTMPCRLQYLQYFDFKLLINFKLSAGFKQYICFNHSHVFTKELYFSILIHALMLNVYFYFILSWSLCQNFEK